MRRFRESSQDGKSQIYSRGCLPTIDEEGRLQFISFHLADSMPKVVLDSWRLEISHLSTSEAEAEIRRREAKYLDQGAGSCLLANPKAASLVADCFFHLAGKSYDLHAWVVMPNHAHVLISPKPLISLAVIVKGWKGVSARRINELCGRSGQLWSREYFDRYIRDDDHFADVVKYIEWNPVKAKLCNSPEDWLFSSAGWRSL